LCWFTPQPRDARGGSADRRRWPSAHQ
jgi:hypothetical protein